MRSCRLVVAQEISVATLPWDPFSFLNPKGLDRIWAASLDIKFF
jgi:hypothetical protein